jgi:hypothetical protein
MYKGVRILLGVLCVVLVVFAAFGVVYFVSHPCQTTVPTHRVVQLEDWCGVAAGQGPDGVDAVLCVSGQTSEFILTTRPSMYTEHNQVEGLVQHGHVTTIQPWARSCKGAYKFFTEDGVRESSLHCHFDLSIIGAPLVFVPVVIAAPIGIQDMLPMRERECPDHVVCGSGLYRMFRQADMAHIPHWYGVHRDDTISATIAFRGQNFSQYTLAIAYADGVQLCHGRREDIRGLDDAVFGGTAVPTFINITLPTLFSCTMVFLHVQTENLPMPIPTTSDVASSLESDRVLGALLLHENVPDATKELRGLRILTRTLVIRDQ